MSTTSLIRRSDLNRWVFPLAQARLEGSRLDGIAATDGVMRASHPLIYEQCLGRVLRESNRKFWAEIWPEIEKRFL